METSTAPSSPKATADTEDEQEERKEQLAETKSLVGGKWVIVKINSGTNYESTMQFIFENGMTVGDLKTKIETETGDPASGQRLIRNGKLAQDSELVGADRTYHAILRRAIGGKKRKRKTKKRKRKTKKHKRKTRKRKTKKHKRKTKKHRR